jgi:hypothetical protein
MHLLRTLQCFPRVLCSIHVLFRRLGVEARFWVVPFLDRVTTVYRLRGGASTALLFGGSRLDDGGGLLEVLAFNVGHGSVIGLSLWYPVLLLPGPGRRTNSRTGSLLLGWGASPGKAGMDLTSVQLI